MCTLVPCGHPSEGVDTGYMKHWQACALFLIYIVTILRFLMKAVYTILLLLLSNVFMTLAWYGHLRLQQAGVSKCWPLIGVIAFSWGIAFFEYCCQVPANRIGFEGTGGPFSLIQLKVIQEVVSLIVFTIIANMVFQGQQLQWNHLAAFLCLIAAVYFVFMK